MKFNLYLLLAVLSALVFILPTVTAGQNNTFKLGEDINVYIYCMNATSSPCSNSVSCNLTAFYPNTTILISQSQMSFNGSGFFNKSLGNLTTIGIYSGLAYCSNIESGAMSFEFTVGLEEDTLWQVSIIFGMLGLSTIFIFIGKMFSKEHWLVKNSMYICSLIMLVILINTGRYFVEGGDSGKLMNSSLLLIIIILIVTFLYLSVFIFKRLFKDLKNSKSGVSI